MYYLEPPFVEEKGFTSLTDDIRNLYYREKETAAPFAKKIIERFHKGEIDLVFYIQADWKEQELQDFHRRKYEGLPLFVENRLGERSIKVEAVVDFILKHVRVSHFDNSWRMETEQVFDPAHKLLEHHKYIYEGDAELWKEEWIFFADQWIIHKED